VANVGVEAAAAGKRALVVTGTGSVKKNGLLDVVMSALDSEGVEAVELSGVVPNPEIGSVREGAALCRERGVDMVLAVGGGSVVDAAKAIAAAADYYGDPWDFFDKKAKPAKALPIGVVLTLSATGSEMNGNSVITNPETSEKRPMYHPALYPRFSILDPELTFTVPPDQTAYGVVDILSHVFEQYFHNVQDTPLQDGLAETIMWTVVNYAPLALKKPDDYNARANLMWASSLALNGLLAAGTGGGDWASHMLEHELSAKYGIAHGAGLAVIFPAWMRRVYKTNIVRFMQFAVNAWGVDPTGLKEEDLAVKGIEAMENYFRNTLNVPVTMADYGIDGSRIEEMADSAMKHKKLGSFMSLSRDDVIAIYETALGS